MSVDLATPEVLTIPVEQVKPLDVLDEGRVHRIDTKMASVGEGAAHVDLFVGNVRGLSHFECACPEDYIEQVVSDTTIRRFAMGTEVTVMRLCPMPIDDCPNVDEEDVVPHHRPRSGPMVGASPLYPSRQG